MGSVRVEDKYYSGDVCFEDYILKEPVRAPARRLLIACRVFRSFILLAFERRYDLGRRMLDTRYYLIEDHRSLVSLST